MSRSPEFVMQSVSGDGSVSVGYDVPFPNDYSELLDQAKEATELALKDKKQLMEIEFPTAGLESVPGDGEGGIEMTGSMQLIREFCDRFIIPEKATRTRIFFPEASEVEFARKSAFGGASFKLDYLTKPSLFQDFGFVSNVKMAERVKPEDELFMIRVSISLCNPEMLVVEELYNEAVVNTARKLIIFNGELDRIRTGCATRAPGRFLLERNALQPLQVPLYVIYATGFYHYLKAISCWLLSPFAPHSSHSSSSFVVSVSRSVVLLSVSIKKLNEAEILVETNLLGLGVSNEPESDNDILVVEF
ncbi:hypothetical protein HHK36_028292 [Tetracentron sinense]|uniref:DUF1995 domain-containing protein n=1 Tax=Tetracentron sinense TaxID=13715 RepID=A0A834YEL3_TETSI|nr:hypothetical protein HHK36_028292 [Tetracentron sinense]